MRPPIFDIRKLRKSFQMPNHKEVLVFQELSLQIQTGEWVALTGRSGCGKTTLLQLLGGLDKPDSGQILLDGKDITTLSDAQLTQIRRKRIGFIFQSYQLLPELNALENAALPALRWGENRTQAIHRAKETLSQFGLADRLLHRPRELSGGEQQRVAIARALINNPDILLADEPTGNLDPAASEEIVSILNTIRKRSQKTIVMVTHDLNLAHKTDRIIALP